MINKYSTCVRNWQTPPTRVKKIEVLYDHWLAIYHAVRSFQQSFLRDENGVKWAGFDDVTTNVYAPWEKSDF